MSLEKILLDPEQFVYRPQHLVLRFEVKIRMTDDCVDEDILDISQQRRAVNQLYPKAGPLAPVYVD